MSHFVTFISLGFLLSATVLAQDNPFLAVRDQDQWAIGEVMEHKVPDPVSAPSFQGPKRGTAPPPKPTFQIQTLQFGAETDQATVKVTLTNLGNSFVLDVTSDQAIQGWLLKRQSTREVFLKGGAPTDNPYKCRIRVERPYLKDFGLTLYVTQDSDPAFVQLF